MLKPEERLEILKCLNQNSYAELRQCLKELHAADIAELLPTLALPQRIKVMRLVDKSKASDILFQLHKDELPPLLEGLGPKRTAEIVGQMFTDDAADLLGELPEEQKNILLGLMEAAEAEDIRELLRYDVDTAGGLMATEYVAVKKDITAAEAINILRKIAPDAETVYYVYVTNEREQLVGVISLRELIVARPDTLIEDIMRTKVISVHVRTDQEEVAKMMSKYDILAVPVVNDDMQLLGIITFDDVMDVMEEEATEDMMRLAGNIEPEGQEMESSFWTRAGKRLPWLIGLLFGELLAGNVIGSLSETLERMTALAFFITALAGGPGNAASQSLTVVVRGLATGEVSKNKILSVVWKETQVGLLVGVVCGTLLSVMAYIWQQSTILGLVVGLSLAVSIVIATVLGSMVPVMMNRLGVDPALASGPFIATLMDITSMMIYFGLATLLIL
ncbi:magnesium transporter [Desulfohalotomaculum tongense]|uniref:magnesium transporter n=1 Tax=Desulforadius tongensis TaxID=1216062 RepID=UPI00195BAF4C|nr:magnesium transporter [Desulforadius tongensis]